MRARVARIIAVALAVLVPLALVMPAYASTPKSHLVKRASHLSASRLSRASVGAPLVANNVPGDPLPASPVAASIGASELDHVYSVSLTAGQVLHATLTYDDPVDNALDIYGYPVGTTDVTSDSQYPVAGMQGWTGHVEMYLPADADGTHYIDIYNVSGTTVPYTLTWQILDKAPGTAAYLSPNPASLTSRYAVAEAAAATAFPGFAGVTDVIVASGADQAMADPLCAAGMAGAYHAPLVLVAPTLSGGKVSANTERVINNIKAANGGKVNIHVIGGTKYIPLAVYNRLAALKGVGGTIERITGSDRYALSLNMARRADAVLRSQGSTTGVSFIMIAAGDNTNAFYDALAASPISYYNVAPTILAHKTTLTNTELSALGSTFANQDRWLISSSTYLASNVGAQSDALGRITGSANRYQAAADIQDFSYIFGLLPMQKVAVANKLSDTLTGGVAMGQLGAPILYTAATGLPDQTYGQLWWYRGGISQAYLLGGTATVGNGVLLDTNDALLYPAPEL